MSGPINNGMQMPSQEFLDRVLGPPIRDLNVPSRTENKAPDADDFAALLGLKEKPPLFNVMLGMVTEDPRFSAANVDERDHRLNVDFVGRLRDEPQHRIDEVNSEFCAKYLPALIDRILDPPSTDIPTSTSMTNWRIFNGYIRMLVELLVNPYCVKYFMSAKPDALRGKAVARSYAEHMAEFAPVFDNRLPGILSRDPIGDLVAEELSDMGVAFRILTALIGFHLADGRPLPIPALTKLTLLRYLDKWVKMLRTEEPTTLPTFLSIVQILKSHPDAVGNLKDTAHRTRNLQICAWAGCRAEHNLFICARCETVLYCGRSHQQKHWLDRNRPHKTVCFKTTY